MKRVLFTASVASHITAFHMPFIEHLRGLGCAVDIACLPDVPVQGVRKAWPVPFSRSPYSVSNVRAFLSLKGILGEQKYDLVHTHTPVAAFITRLAAKRSGTPVLYTAHGFHFYQGGPFRDNLLYHSLEQLAAPWTAGLVVMNREDLEAAKRLGLAESVNLFFVHGVGLDLQKYRPEAKDLSLDSGLSIKPETPVVLCVAEFTWNKNHLLLLDAWRTVVKEMPAATLLFVGTGSTQQFIRQAVADYGLSRSVRFLGYRTDAPRLYNRADVVVLTSRREGLPRSIMEAMAVGKPVVATDVRGSRDLVGHGTNGLLIPLDRPLQLAEALVFLLTHPDVSNRMGELGQQIVKEYSIDRVVEEMARIYCRYLDEPSGVRSAQ
jgi:glycosyltransferase involved in cell wall biosynthesis